MIVWALTSVFILLLSLNVTVGSPPTVIVALDDELVQSNPNIPAIFDKFHTYNGGGEDQVKFETVLWTNASVGLRDVCTLADTGTVAVLDMTSNGVLQSAVRGIPYIALRDRSNMELPLLRSDNQVLVETTSTQMLSVIAAIARQESLNNIALIYDTTFAIQRVPRRILTNVPAQHLYIQLSENRAVNERNINTIVDFDIEFIFIIASKANAQLFLTLMSEKRTLDTKSSLQNFDPNIFILTKDATVTCGSCKGQDRVVQITAGTNQMGYMKLKDYMKSILPGVGRDYDIYRVKVDEAMAFDLARLISTAVNNLSNITNQYDTCGFADVASNNSEAQSSSLTNELTRVSISGVLGPLSFSPQYDAITYDMTLLISEVVFRSGELIEKSPLANYSRQEGLKTIGELRKEKKKMRYRVVTIAEIPPFVYKRESQNGTGVYYEGYCIELLEEIAKEVNFDYDIYDVDSVGSMDDSTGNWTGAIQELIEDRADIAVGPISVMAERENVIDFTVPYYDLVGLTILMRKPKFDYSLVKFLSVLDEEVWGCIIGAFFLFSILISVFDKLSPFSYQNRKAQWKGSGSEPRVFTLKEGVWFCMMSLTPQGGGETPKALSGRLIAATWWLFGFIIIATYTANLAAFLTVSRLETPIESLDDLSNQFKVQYAPMNNSVAMIYFKRMANIEHRFYEIWKQMSLNDDQPAINRAKLAVWDYPVSDKYTKLWETMEKSGFPQNKSEAVRRVLEENFAFISDATTNKYQTLINCDLWEVGEEFSRKPYALAVRQGSSLRTQLSDAILKLINQRVLEELKTKWWREDKKDCPKLEDESDGISIRNIGGVFLVIAIGSGLSLLTLAFECYWYRLRPDRSASKKPSNINDRKRKSTLGVPNNHSSRKSSASKENNMSNGKTEGHSTLDPNFVSMQFSDINPGIGIGAEFTADRIIDRVQAEWF